MIKASHAGYVLDASAGVKWIKRDELLFDKAIALANKFIRKACKLVVPELFFLEAASSIRLNKSFNEQQRSQALSYLWNLNLGLFPMTDTVLLKTNSISHKYNISIYDASYIALAEITGFPLITADEKLIDGMKGNAFILSLKELEFD